MWRRGLRDERLAVPPFRPMFHRLFVAQNRRAGWNRARAFGWRTVVVQNLLWFVRLPVWWQRNYRWRAAPSLDIFLPAFSLTQLRCFWRWNYTIRSQEDAFRFGEMLLKYDRRSRASSSKHSRRNLERWQMPMFFLTVMILKTLCPSRS